MSRESDKYFQKCDFSSFIEKRRNNFLNKTRQKRDHFFEKLTNNLKNNNNNNNSNNYDNDIIIGRNFDFSFNSNNNDNTSNDSNQSNNNNDGRNTMEMDEDRDIEHKNDNTSPKRKRNKKRHKQAIKSRIRRLKLVKQFMLHDWMTDIPTDFRENVCIIFLYIFMSVHVHYPPTFCYDIYSGYVESDQRVKDV